MPGGGARGQNLGHHENELYSSKEVLHHLNFFIFLSDILTNNF